MTWWQNDKMTWWHNDMTLPWSLITILCLLSKVYRLKCLKFETKTHSLTHLLTRVKSRDVFLNTHPSLVTNLIIDAVMTLLIVISMPTKMTIFNDTYPRYMIHDQWWWHMMIIMIYDTWHMMNIMIYDIDNFEFSVKLPDFFQNSLSFTNVCHFPAS